MNLTELYEYERKRRVRSELVGAVKVLAAAICLAALCVISANADHACPPGQTAVSVDQCAPATDPFLSDDATLLVP